MKLTLNVADRLLEAPATASRGGIRGCDGSIPQSGWTTTFFAPYTPVKAEGRDVSVLGRTVRLAGTGCSPAS